MINLIKKEFMIQKKYFLLLLGYSFFMLIAFSISPSDMAQSAYMAAAIGIVYMFIQYSCAIEDKNKSEKILNSLPISRKKIVLSKYGAIMLFSMLSVIVVGLAGMLVLKLSFTYIRIIELENIVAILSIAWMLAAIYLPVYFKFGYIKAKAFNMIIFFIFFFGPMFAKNYLQKYIGSSSMESILNFMASKGPIAIAGIALFASMILVIISAIISTRVYYNREFN
ncbi:ABC-2 transporter permease [Alkaliphilus sp. B6464]|uniref:ABC-2 transporter permease n=1 Tax=Alkaliphilus sp. B6464 TaxID=2731219 RepID=UPI001BA93C42|nr:ABC-2 transporter permease [Alkaliphilus sp. B6464]QUH18527.1 ABC-2 transporter permease [Alkaliphilus sp. B6464]